MEVRVGPLVVTVHADDQFLVCKPDATIHPESAEGYFVSDTRLVSNYRLTLSRARPVLVNSSPIAPFSARFEFVNDRVATTRGPVERGDVHLRVDRVIGRGLHEDYELTNYAPNAVELDLEIRVEGDYADLFDVKSGSLVRRGALQTVWDRAAGALTTTYANQDFRRGLRLQVDRNGSEPEFANGTVSFRVCLEPRERWHSCLLWMPIAGDGPPHRPREQCHALLAAAGEPDGEPHRWASPVTQVETGDPAVDAVVSRAVDDLGAMRLHRHDDAPDATEGTGFVPAAGIPWFVTLFGRDTLVVSLQTVLLSPDVALATLRALAPLQGERYDDAHDCQPGKIEHEVRHGELAHFHLVPQTPYYGTHDATTLYVWAAAELWRWTGDRQALAELRPHVERALHWIDSDGDIDGDGLQEYRTRAGTWGYYNQGWKDSGVAIVDADGALSKLPIATCELQGYVVAAKRAWADAVEQAFDDAPGANRLRSEAGRLAEAIEARFWWSDEGTYYLGLDGDKRPIASVASNAGHLLWSGAVAADRAASVVARLLGEDMWSGWGVRTLSADHPSYNPFSYQRGSVWPHDNAILAAGFLRYGHREEAWRVARALFDAAERFQHVRLPEVFAGLTRDVGAFPAQYLGANVPQAWASGAVIHLVSALAGLSPDAVGGRLSVAPAIPDWLGHLRLRGVRVGAASVDLQLSQQGAVVEGQRGGLHVESR
jgi:glycogen debranching enzyme